MCMHTLYWDLRKVKEMTSSQFMGSLVHMHRRPGTPIMPYTLNPGEVDDRKQPNGVPPLPALQ